MMQLEERNDVEHVDTDEPVCIDMLKPDDEPDTYSRRRRSFETDEICWNVDRIDERYCPLDGDYCPPVDGT